jgi:hypothetical protein
MIKRIAYTAFAASLVTSSGAAISADSYLLEGYLGAMQLKTTFGGNSSNADGKYAGLTLHSASVPTFDIPLREASFINRSNYLTIEQTQFDNDGTNDNSDETNLEGRYVLASGMFIEAGYTKPSDFEDAYGIGIGQYLGISSATSFRYETLEDSDFDHYAGNIHYAAPYGANAGWITYDFGAGYIQAGDLDGYSAMAGMDYYFNSRVSLGGAYFYQNIDSSDVKTYQITGEYFIGNKLSIAAKYQNEKVLGITGEAAGVTFSFRY